MTVIRFNFLFSTNFNVNKLYLFQMCSKHNNTPRYDDHYRAVCRALATECTELKIFLEKVFHGDAEDLRLKAQSETSQQELAQLGFSDWVRFFFLFFISFIILYKTTNIAQVV